MANAPNIAPADPNAYLRPQEWHEAINPFAAAYRGVAPILTGQSAAMRPEDYAFAQAMAEAQAQQNAARSGQMTNAEAILARAMGQGGPSLAEMQMRQGTDRLLKQQAGLMGSIRGQNPALTQYRIMDQAGMAQQQANADAAMLRAQEQQNAQMLAMQAYGQIRGQDQGMFGAGMQGRQGQNQLNVTSDLDAQRMNLQRELANQQAIQNQQAMQYGSDRAAAQRNTGIVSGVGQMAGQAAAAAATGGASEAMGAASKMSGGLASGQGGMLLPMVNPPGYSGGGYIPMVSGGVVPGVPVVPGDSPMNDTVPIAASAGEVVIPKSSAGSPEAAAEFVRGLQSQSNEDDRLARLFDLQARLDALKGGANAGKQQMAYGGMVGGKKAC